VDQWLVLVNTVMNLLVIEKLISWLTKWLLDFHEGLCSIELVINYS
jgi:hypothetical protein